MQAYCSILVDLQHQPCLVVGGGKVAERKIDTLLEYAARITVVSPELTEKLAALEAKAIIRVYRRPFQAEDLRTAFLVLACTDSPDANRQICEEAIRAGKLVNSAAPGEAGNVILPATLRRGRLTLSVSTLGASPSLAMAIRDQWEQEFGAEYEQYLEFLAEFRELVQKHIKDPCERRKWFKDMVHWDVLEAARNSRLQQLFEEKRSLLLQSAAAPRG
ncbi:precorrin-2 dehydrogenase/sirohydrochlorin ferrochelatase family protein [Paenibacillus senegalensis]|uniref:precorrin-2 dehydrogenase/sirohydrochlorin ferrochelatase family protein n=1 Tax=Paenibacillus senegalensis TaxID=1465766 RepID=UPI000287E498|nr:NAD(P)-dependent oxidoreductase [Paenibacillus senegalensis]